MLDKITAEKRAADTDKTDLPAGLDGLRWTDDDPPRVAFEPAAYERLMSEIIRDFAPRRFAIAQELREHEDGRIAAWGLVTDDDTFDLIDTETGHHITLHYLEMACRLYTRLPDVGASVRWIDPPRAVDLTDPGEEEQP